MTFSSSVDGLVLKPPVGATSSFDMELVVGTIDDVGIPTYAPSPVTTLLVGSAPKVALSSVGVETEFSVIEDD